MLTKLTAKNDGREWSEVFLETLAASGNISLSCQAAHVSRQYVYETRKVDVEFAASWDNALGEAADILEAEAMRRTMKGAKRYKFDKHGDPILHPKTGQPYFERHYSDTLLIFLLKGAKPEKYRERHEISGPDGGAIPLTVESAISKVYGQPDDTEKVDDAADAG